MVPYLTCSAMVYAVAVVVSLSVTDRQACLLFLEATLKKISKNLHKVDTLSMSVDQIFQVIISRSLKIIDNQLKKKFVHFCFHIFYTLSRVTKNEYFFKIYFYVEKKLTEVLEEDLFSYKKNIIKIP